MVAPAYRGVARWHSSGKGRTTPNPLPRAEGGWSPGIPDIKMADGEETWVKNRVAKDRLARKRELRLTDFQPELHYLIQERTLEFFIGHRLKLARAVQLFGKR
jgi:hypothetical protein